MFYRVSPNSVQPFRVIKCHPEPAWPFLAGSCGCMIVHHSVKSSWTRANKYLLKSLFWLSYTDWIVKRGTGEKWEGAFAFQVSTFKSLLAAAPQLSPACLAYNLTSSSLAIPLKWEFLRHLTLMFGRSPTKSKCKRHCLIVLQVTSERKMHSTNNIWNCISFFSSERALDAWDIEVQ